MLPANETQKECEEDRKKKGTALVTFHSCALVQIVRHFRSVVHALRPELNL